MLFMTFGGCEIGVGEDLSATSDVVSDSDVCSMAVMMTNGEVGPCPAADIGVDKMASMFGSVECSKSL